MQESIYNQFHCVVWFGLLLLVIFFCKRPTYFL